MLYVLVYKCIYTAVRGMFLVCFEGCPYQKECMYVSPVWFYYSSLLYASTEHKNSLWNFNHNRARNFFSGFIRKLTKKWLSFCCYWILLQFLISRHVGVVQICSIIQFSNRSVRKLYYLKNIFNCFSACNKTHLY